MANLIHILDKFNESQSGYVTTESLFSFLDQHAPQWKEEIRDNRVWQPLFEHELKLYDRCFYPMVLDWFDMIDNNDALIAVWKDYNCNDWYKLAAIRRLRLFDEATYLPQYIDWFKNALGAEAFVIVEELFDFDGAIEMAQDMALSPQSNMHEKEIGLEYLAKNACRLWDKYPKKVRELIINKHDYFICTECDEKMWRKMSHFERSSVINHIRNDEALKKNNKISPYLKMGLVFNMV